MREIINKIQSRYGIASCLIGILNLSYIWILLSNPFAGHKSFFGKFEPFGQVSGLFFIPLLFLVIPAIGNGIGLTVGIIGLFQPNCKRTFSVLGLIMNSLIPITLFILLLRIFWNP